VAELRPVSAESQRLAQERRLEPLKKNQSQHSRKRGEHQYGGRPKTCPLSPLYLRADLFPRRQPQRAVSVGRRKIFQKSSTPHQKVSGPSDLKPLLSRTASSLLLLRLHLSFGCTLFSDREISPQSFLGHFLRRRGAEIDLHRPLRAPPSFRYPIDGHRR